MRVYACAQTVHSSSATANKESRIKGSGNKKKKKKKEATCCRIKTAREGARERQRRVGGTKRENSSKETAEPACPAEIRCT